LWVVGCGLWVVGCGLCCGLVSAVSYDTHFVDHTGKQNPPKMMVMKWTPFTASMAEQSAYYGDYSAMMTRGWELEEGHRFWGD
jgi:hypothetical protein